jgi:hypothetical protein
VVVLGSAAIARTTPDKRSATSLLPGPLGWGDGLGVAQIGIVGAAAATASERERGMAAGTVNTTA